MRIPLRVAVVAGLLFLLPSASHAGKIFVEFDFTGSSVALLGGFIDVPPDGTINAGSAQLKVPGAGIATPGGGPASLKNMTLAGTISKTGLGVTISGAFGATQPGTATGGLSGGLGHLTFNPFVVNFTGFANCANAGTGTGCTVLGLPATFTGPKTFTINSLAVSQLTTVGSAALNGTFTFTLGGFTAVLTLVGSEISRTFLIPEPNTAGLLALGLAGLAAVRRGRR